MTDVEKTIQQRIELCDTEVAPLLEKKEEELANITITPGQFRAYMEAVGQKTFQLDSELKEHILGTHSHYCGRMEGMQMALKLFALMRAPKIPYICDRGDTPYTNYKCGNCGSIDVYEDAKFCSECGVALYFEAETAGGKVNDT